MPEDRNKRNWLKWLGNFLLIAFAIGALQWWQTRDLPAGPAPPLAGRLLDGRWVDLKDYRGTPILVHFWATWCPICRAEEGSISSLAEDVSIVTVATGSGDAAQLSKYLEKNRLGFAVLADENGELARRWKIVGVPASFVIDPRGDIAAVTVGYTTEIGLRLRLWLAKD